MARRLETSSDDWYKFTEKADKIQRKYSDARTSDLGEAMAVGVGASLRRA